MRIFSIWLQASQRERRGVEQHTDAPHYSHSQLAFTGGREREIELDTRLTNVGEGLGGGERACPGPHVSTTLYTNTGVAYHIAQAQRRFEDN